MEELGGETQLLAAPQGVACIEADRAILLIVKVFQLVGQRGVRRLPRVLRQIPRQIAHGRIVEGHCLLCPRATRQRSDDRQKRTLQQNIAAVHHVSPEPEWRPVSPADWGEIMPFKLS